MKKIFSTMLIVMLTSSCALVLDGRKQQLAFDSNEKDIEIYINHKFMCKTPCIAEVKREKKKLMITAKKLGYNDRTVFTEGTLNSTSVINLISLWSAPSGFSTDMTSGSMWKYLPNSFYVTLTPEPKTRAEKRLLEEQNKIRNFVLRNFDQLQNDAFGQEGGGEYLKALSAMSGVSIVQIKTALQNSFAGPDCAEKIVGLHLENKK